MNDNLYVSTVPHFIKTLAGLRSILDKASAFAKEKGIAEESLLGERLAPDMFPLVKQVQVACDQAKGAAARLAGVEIPKFEDHEKSIAELQSRIDKTLEFLRSVPEKAFGGAATRQVTLPYFPGKYMDGADYAREYAMPNFYFHITVAYGLLRRAGLQIGKADYIAGLPLKDL